MQGSDGYTIQEHVHRFAAWAASRAASTSNGRFPVSTGQVILREAGFRRLVDAGTDGLPHPGNVDEQHRQWRSDVIRIAEGHRLTWTHGIAAKLINCYLKAVFVTLATSGHPKVVALHPPVDRLLLNQLARSGGDRSVVWARYRDRGWSNFGSGEYEAVIGEFRAQLGPDSPLWRIESHWSGFQ